MKNRLLLLTALVFFFLISTSYFWEDLPGLWDMGLALVLGLTFIFLSVCLLNQLYQLIREKFRDKQRIASVVVLSLILGLAVLFPSGIINFENLEGEDTLIAQREGSANCMTTFRLKKNKRFSQQSICFGVDTKKGDYTIKNDTIFLSYTSRGDSSDYAFAVIKKDSPYTGHAKGELILFRNTDDVNPLFLLITKYVDSNNFKHPKVTAITEGRLTSDFLLALRTSFFFCQNLIMFETATIANALHAFNTKSWSCL